MIKEADAKMATVVASVAAYEALGTVEDLTTVVAKVEAVEALGSIEDITALSKKSVEMAEELSTYREIGSVDDINETLGTSIDTIESYVALGTIETVAESLDMLTAFENLGTIEDLKEVVETVEAAKVSADIIKVMEATGATEEVVTKTMSFTGTADEAITFLSEVKGLSIDESDKTPKVVSLVKEGEDKKEKTPEQIAMQESLARVLGTKRPRKL
jgi:hypothetical protein